MGKICLAAGQNGNTFLQKQHLLLWPVAVSYTHLGTSREHIIRAALESIAYQTCDVLHAMEEDTGVELENLRVDGGASANRFLMQFQADMIGRSVLRLSLIHI